MQRINVNAENILSVLFALYITIPLYSLEMFCVSQQHGSENSFVPKCSFSQT